MNVCSGHGSCLAQSGTCLCRRKWRGAIDCSKCTPGYLSKDCSVAVTAPTEKVPITSVFGTGYYVTLDGVKINVNVAGEFNVLALTRYQLSIQFRQVRIGRYVRLRCAVVRVRENVIAIHSSIGRVRQVLITLNSLPVNFKTIISLGVSGFVFQHTSLNRYTITGPGGFHFLINSLAIHFDVSVTMDRWLCQEACGLLGRCRIPGSSVTPSNCPNGGGILDTYDISTVTKDMLVTYFNKWTIPANESSFGPVLEVAGESPSVNGGGSCLFFNGTSIVSSPLVNVFVGNYITVQLFVKAKDPRLYPGTIISYAQSKTFAITVNGSIRIHFGAIVIDTQLILEAELWNHISFVYRRSSGLVQFYLINSLGVIQTRVFFIGVGVFPEGGTLSIALWQITSAVSLSIPGFVGWVDELSFWNKRFDSVMIQETWNTNLQVGTPGIALLWKFNEGSGFSARATVGSFDFSLATPPFQGPVWYPSDAVTEDSAYEIGKPLEEEIDNSTKELCSDIFLKGPLHDECSNATGASDFYYDACIAEVSSSRSRDSVLATTRAFGEECQAALNLSTLPGQKLCNVLPGGRYNNWVGINCTTRCLVGWYSDGACKCDSGYWGVNCSKLCPGGASNPCFGNGQCDVETGACKCHPNWKGDQNCSSCTPGWKGSSCSVAATTTDPSVANVTIKICTISERGYVTGFDGSLFTFTTLGEFFMINSTILQVHIRQVPCEVSSVCINAVGVRFNGLTISVHAPYDSESQPVVYANDQQITPGGEPTKKMLVNKVTVQPLSSTAYKIVISHYLSIRTVFADRYLSVESTIPFSFCQLAEGLCGSCSKVQTGVNETLGNGSSVFTTKRPTTVLEEFGGANASYSDVDGFVKEKLSVKGEREFAIVIDEEFRKETRVIYGGIYSLYYSFTAVVTQSALRLFVSQTVTFQLLVKSCDPRICGGTLISYTSNVTFYISNHNTLKVVIGLEVFNTGIVTEKDVWNQISVVFDRSKLQLFVFVTFSSGLVQARKFNVTVDPFIAKGTFAIGMWQPASGSISVQPTNVFSGQIDEVCVWSRPFDYALVQQSWRANIQPNAPSLTNLWKFNEGENAEVKDLVSGVTLSFPKYPLGSPQWVFSDAPISSVVEINPNENNATLQGIATQVCFGLIFRGPIYTACRLLGNVTLEFYFRACVEAVVDGGSTVQSIDAVITISDYCEKTLGLSYWPAQPLCNKFPGKRFPNWIGINCTIPCIFGQASNDSEVCKCDPGFYGANCSGICPGGKGRACNNHGVCDVVTGECFCELNWRGNENCTACSSGWAGTDCSTTVTRWPYGGALVGAGSVSLGGYFTSLSGISYTLHVTGEYYLIYSIYVSVVVQIRLVSCFEHSTCINSIAIKISSQTVFLHGPYTSGGNLVVWLNGKVIDTDLHPITMQTYGFQVNKITPNLWEVIYTGLNLKIRITGRYLSLSTKTTGLVCKSAFGLLGSCNQGFLESLVSYYPNSNCSDESFTFNATGNQPNGFPYTDDSASSVTKNVSNDKNTTTGDVITALIVAKLKVKACHSLFQYNYKDLIEYRDANAGYALYFDHTTVVSGVIYEAFLSTDISIKMMFKTVRYGVIFSYTRTKTFFVTNKGGKFTVYYGDKDYPTNIDSELNKWNQISIVFRKSNNVLQFYYFSSGGQLHRLDIYIGVDIFVPGGIIALAGWMPSLDGSGIQPAEYFAGFFDEVRIWTRYFHPAFILQTWNRSVSVETKDIAHAWKFNEGEGIVAVDMITGMKLELPFKPWRIPEWRYSDVTLQTPFYSRPQAFSFHNKTFQEQAEHFCNITILMGPLNIKCNNLGPGVATFYYRSCLRRISTLESLYMSMEVMISYADYCHVVNNLTAWPAKPLCNEYPGRDFPIWFGQSCDRKCVFGKKIDSETCTCYHGYWGPECENPCPGGAATPCNNNGVCDRITGKCDCHANYNGTLDCGRCSLGWTGTDCSLALVSLRKLHVSIAISSTGGHYVTFDGYSFTLVAVGEYYLINVPHLSFQVHVRQVPCRLQSVCVNAIGIRVLSTVISFHAPYIAGAAPVVWVNGKFILLSGLLTSLGDPRDGIQLKFEAHSHYQLSWKDQFAIRIRIAGRYLSFKVDVDPKYCTNSTGLLGSCDNDTNNDLKVSSNTSFIPANISQSLLNDGIGSHAAVLEKDSLVVLKYEHYQETTVPSGGIYAIFFNRTGVSTQPLTKTFISNVDITVEILVKPYQLVGTIFSYAVLQTFAITIENSIVIYFGNTVINTGVAATVKQWSHISLVWNYKTNVLEFYHFDFTGKVQRRSYMLPSNPFVPGGILSLGQWELSPGDNETYTFTSFVGIIDEFRVWKRAFNPALVQQNWRMNVLPTDPDVTGLWKINEGESDVIKNLASNEHLYLPRSPWEQPVWVFSDAEVNTNFTSNSKPFETRFPNKTLESEAKSFCLEVFYSSKIYDFCHAGLKAELEFYYLVCLKDIATTGYLSTALTAVVTFSDHCQAVLNLTIWPAQRLCNKFPGVHFPLWIGDKCDIKCVFGAADPEDRNLCICSEGYWGSDCSHLCPGELLNTCGGHGWCDRTTGKCKCEANWAGDSNCSSCSPGWNGTNCQFAVNVVTGITSNTIVVASVGGYGYFSTFFGVSFTHRVVGEFYLLRSPAHNFFIQLRQAPCVIDGTFTSLCTTGFGFGFRSNHVVIRAPVAKLSKTVVAFPLVWLNNRAVEVDHRTQLSAHFVMVRISTVTFHIYGPHGIKFVLTVGHSLAVTMHMPKGYCQNSTGLLGACKIHTFNESNNLETYITALTINSVVGVSETMFIYKFLHYMEHRVPTGAGFNLFFTDHSVRSDPMYFPDVDVLTVELLVKAHKSGGVIFSYSSQRLFAVVDNVTLVITYSGSMFHTGLTLDIGQWNQISLVYMKLVGILHFYFFSFSGEVKVRVFKLDSHVFTNGGVLAIGQWQPSPGSDNLLPESSFVGEIDEMRIWKRRTNPDLVKGNWGLNVQADTYPDLLHLWKFNQAEGRVIRDLRGKSDLLTIKFHEPLWSFSDANIPPRRPTNTAFVKAKLRQDAESFCFSLILSGSLYAKCEALTIQVAQFYYKACLHDISLSLDLHSAVHAVVTFADFCQSSLELIEWPAKSLCHHFVLQRFPYWIGLRCTTKCVFGYSIPDVNGTEGVSCMCEPSYWGEDCSSLCPGGLRRTCNGHGVCNVMNGTCECDPHWKGNITNVSVEDQTTLPCSKCSDGWTGIDCSVADQSPIVESSETQMALNFGDPHFTSVSGVNFHFEVPGAYQLINSSAFVAQVLIVPCNNRMSCRRISEIALRTSQVILFVRYSDLETIESGTIAVGTNESSKLDNSDEWMEIADIKYRWLKTTILEVAFLEYEEVQINILTYNGTLGTAILMPKSMRPETDGICGEKEGKWIREYSNKSLALHLADPTKEPFANASSETVNQHVLSQETLDLKFGDNFILKEKDNFLTTKNAWRSFSGAGYMLEFSSSNTAVMFASNSSLPVLDEFTIEIWVCLVNKGSNVGHFCSSSQNLSTERIAGTHAIFSAATGSGGLAIICKDGLQINWDENRFVTGISIQEGVWTYLAVTWRTIDGRLQAYAHAQGEHRESTTFGVKTGKQFSFDGVLIFGRYIRGYMMDSKYDMRGALDEFKVKNISNRSNNSRLLFQQLFIFIPTAISGFFLIFHSRKINCAML